jgi:hypothetical protein
MMGRADESYDETGSAEGRADENYDEKQGFHKGSVDERCAC